MGKYTYGLCYIPENNTYWCGGNEFDLNLEAAQWCYLDSNILIWALKEFGGELKTITTNAPMQVI